MNNNHKILIIGDFTEESLDIQDFFNKVGYKAYSTVHGQQGLQLAKGHQPDLILIDLALPDIPGLEVMRILKEEPSLRNTSFLLSSLDSSEESIIICLSSGAHDYVYRPIHFTQILAKVQNLLELSESRKMLEELNNQLTKERDIARNAKEIAEEERNRANKLLINILPVKIAEELKENGKIEPQFYSSVTILFTDFKDFSKIAKNLKPNDLVKELDFFFTQFDKIIKKYKLEKLKTIGDSYMCVGGLPEKNQTHPSDVCRAALEIQHFMSHNSTSTNGTNWQLRIGIHTGAVVAGVIGQEKFAFDVWGDAVNIASRMESSCDIGKINISKSTYQLVKDSFTCTNRGLIQIKNMDNMESFFLEGVKDI